MKLSYLGGVQEVKNQLLDEIKVRLEKGIKDHKLDPQGAIPTLVVKIPIEHHDDDNCVGFSVRIDQKTFKPLHCSVYLATGQGTDRKSNLTPEEFELFLSYYGDEYFSDLWQKYCEVILDESGETVI